MKTSKVILKDKLGNILCNDDIVYLKNDIDFKFPLRRVVRWSLYNNARILNDDCRGMEGEGDFNIDAFWNYYNDSFSELSSELSGDSQFEELIVDLFEL
jgi:hypothetical protein